MTQEQQATDPQERPPGPVEDLTRRLTLRRALGSLKRTDAVQRLQARVDHRIQVSQARAKARRDQRARREENKDAFEASTLNDLYRRASVSGERARIRSQIQQSAEMRSMRVERVRRTSLLVLVPVLVAFAAWSTSGVHYGFVTLLDVPTRSPMWWTAWGIEPALITIVAGIIVVRAVLRSAGGDLDRRATFAEWGALSTSVALNMAGHWPDTMSLTTVAAVVAHSIGPIGAAATAWLAGVVDDAVSRATPEEGAPSLADMGLSRRATHTVEERQDDSDTAVSPPQEATPVVGEADIPVLEASVAAPVAPTTPDTATPVASDKSQANAPVVSMSDRSERDKQVITWLANDPDMSGAEIGRRVGATPRTGQRLKDRLAPVAEGLRRGDTDEVPVASQG